MSSLLKDKTAIITGASKGIGLAIAQLFAEEGANVVLTARNANELNQVVKAINEKSHQEQAIGVVADVAEKDSVDKVFSAAIKAFNQIDILVNNAGMGDMTSIEETTDERLMQILNTNLISVFRYSRQAIQHFMTHDNKGTIVNISSVNGNRPVSGAAYTISKGAVNTLTKNIAIRFAGTGIRCNAVAPGVTNTPMTSLWEKSDLKESSMMWEYNKKFANLDLPATEAIDQAYAALYFASDQSRSTTGQILQVCNGSFL